MGAVAAYWTRCKAININEINNNEGTYLHTYIHGYVCTYIICMYISKARTRSRKSKGKENKGNGC